MWPFAMFRRHEVPANREGQRMSDTIKHFNKEQIGYFTSPYPDAKPDFDPAYPIECPYCFGEVNDENVRTTSVAYLEGRQVSAFIRSHRACNDADKNNDLDGKVLETISEMVRSGEIAP
jgi:hypothetical protein